MHWGNSSNPGNAELVYLILMFERRKQTGSDDVDLAGQTPEGRLFQRVSFVCRSVAGIFGKEHEFM